MTNQDAIGHLNYMRKAYQKLISEKVDSGKFVGTDIQGEWKADTPLDDAYKVMIVSLDMAIKALKTINEIIDYMNDNTVSWRDITDDIIKDILVRNGWDKGEPK